MRFELDVLLEKPSETIDINLLKEVYLNSCSYEILLHKSNNYLLLQKSCENFKIRIHEDGRIYIKTEINLKGTSKKVILRDMLQQLKDFLEETQLINQYILRNEINFSFCGTKAQSVFWEKYNELIQIGEEVLKTYDLRTYSEDNYSVYVKLTSDNRINILS